jgi:hypothetical protein
MGFIGTFARTEAMGFTPLVARNQIDTSRSLVFPSFPAWPEHLSIM